ncbi:MAG: hypothetical protein JWM85_3179 [Acidimicrobiaceae bacterium]|nr:hypothetical protein [Acidimicrobiaceae bacterium]
MTRTHRAALTRRLPIVAFVVALLVLAGVADGTVHRHAGAEATVSVAPDSVVRMSRSVLSAAWYCPGPLPVGKGAQASTIWVANAGSRAVRGEIVLSGTDGSLTTHVIAVGARSQDRYGLPTGGPRRELAASVVMGGPGIAIDETIDGPTGPLASPCLSHTSSSSYLAAGGSQNADDVSLSLYNPGSTPAVADVSFATSNGPAAPPSFQGVPVGAGSVVVLDVGRAIPGRALVATTVSSKGGQLVAGARLTVARGHGVEQSLVSASPAPSRQWTFPPAPAGPGTTEELAVYNPGPSPARLQLLTGGTGGRTESVATVPAGGILALAPGGEAQPGAVRYEHLTVVHGSAVVVARELVLSAPAYPRTSVTRHAVRVVTEKVRGKSVRRRKSVSVRVIVGPPLVASLPNLPDGYAIGEAVASPTKRWVVPAAAGTGEGELLEVSNPGLVPAQVQLRQLAGTPLPGAPATPAALPSFTIPAGGALTVSLAQLPPPAGSRALIVSSSQPVVVAGSLYAKASPKALGFGTPLATPVTQ